MNYFNKSEINRQLIAACRESENIVDLKHVFEQKIADYELNKTRVAALLDIDKHILDDFIRGEAKQPSLLTLIKIADFLEIDLNEAAKYILKQSPEHNGAIEKARTAIFIAKHFDVKKLTKEGFFEEGGNTDYLAERVLHFFDYYTLFQYDTQLDLPVFDSAKGKVGDKMKDFWLKSAHCCFTIVNNPNRYSEEDLEGLMPNIRPLCKDEKRGLVAASKALYRIGVTLLIQNGLQSSPVGPGILVVNSKPCIVLSDCGKHYAAIWTSLIKALYQVRYHLDEISERGYQLCDAADPGGMGDLAEEFAQEYFCGLESYNQMASSIETPLMVKRLARKMDIHPAFIYSAFQYFGKKIQAGIYRKVLKASGSAYDVAVKPLTSVSWKAESLADVAQKLKKVFETPDD